MTVDGKDTYTAHVRSDFSNWSIGLAIPADIVLAGVRRTSWLIAIGVLASIAVAMAIVGVSGRRIARPIVSLATVAQSIGTGNAGIATISGDVQEVTGVAAALSRASKASGGRKGESASASRWSSVLPSCRADRFPSPAAAAARAPRSRCVCPRPHARYPRLLADQWRPRARIHVVCWLSVSERRPAGRTS